MRSARSTGALDAVTTSADRRRHPARLDRLRHRAVTRTWANCAAEEQADIGGTDIASTVTQLQQAMLVLEASQASFAKLSGLSLFDQLR
jgi:hypothetical protein